MAIIKFVNKPYLNENALENMFHYLTSQTDLINDTSTLEDYTGGYNFNLYDVDSIAAQFKYVKQHFHKSDSSQLIHFIISFPYNELKSVNKAREFADFICRKYSYTYQIFYAIHNKQNNLHIHFVVNTISFVDGKRFYSLKGQPSRICNETNYYFGKQIAHFG